MPLLHRQLIHKSNKAMESPSVVEIVGGLAWDQTEIRQQLRIPWLFFIRHGSQEGAHGVPVIQTLLKKPKVLSGPRKQTYSDLRNNDAVGPIILKTALILCVKSVGSYQILVLMLVKSTATSLTRNRMFNMFVAIFCSPCINFWYSNVTNRSQEIQWNANNVGKSLQYPSATWGDIVFLQNTSLITDSITQKTVNNFHNAWLLGTKRIFRTFFSLTSLFWGIFFTQISLTSWNILKNVDVFLFIFLIH